jgi:hypothetical protein
MPTYSLQIHFTKEQLEVFYAAGAWVVIGKPLKGDAPSLAWVTFPPFEWNSVEWEEQYGIYASLAIASGDDGVAQQQQCKSEFPASAGRLYPLRPEGCFGPPTAEAGLDPDSYYAANSFVGAPTMTFGLFQDAKVNGQKRSANPLSAELIPTAFQARMIPGTTLYLWMQSEGGQVTSPQTRVPFEESTTSMALVYDSSSGTFVPSSANA